MTLNFKGGIPVEIVVLLTLLAAGMAVTVGVTFAGAHASDFDDDFIGLFAIMVYLIATLVRWRVLLHARCCC